MSTFGVFGGGSTPMAQNNGLPNYQNQGLGNNPAPNFQFDNQQQQPNFFGQFTELLQGEANRQGGIPEGYLPVPGQPHLMRDIPDHRGGAMDIVTTHRNPNYNPGLSGSEQVQGAIMGDYQRAVDINQENWARRDEANRAYRDMMLGGADAVERSGQESADALSLLADKNYAESERLSGLGQGVVDTAKSGIAEMKDQFQNRAAEDASVINEAALRRTDNQMDQLEAQLKATNDPAVAQQIEKLQSETNVQTQRNATQYASQYNMAEQQMNAAGVQMATQASQAQMGFENLSANSLAAGQQLNTQGIAIKNQALNYATNMRSQGLKDYAAMVASNPTSMMAFLPSLMALFQYKSTPGADKYQGIAPELLGMNRTAIA